MWHEVVSRVETTDAFWGVVSSLLIAAGGAVWKPTRPYVLYAVGLVTGMFTAPYELRKLRERDNTRIVLDDQRHLENKAAIAQMAEGMRASDEKKMARLTAIEAELKTNGGSSLRDAINYIRSDVNLGNFISQEALAETLAFRSDANGNCVWSSPKWCELAGLTLAESLGSGWTRAIVEEDRQRVWEQWQSCIRDKRTFAITYHYRGWDNKPVHVETVAQMILDGPRVVGWFGRVRRLEQN